MTGAQAVAPPASEVAPQAIDTVDANLMPLAQKIAQGIASGVVAQPDDPSGWQSLVNQFQTGGPIPGTEPVTPAANTVNLEATTQPDSVPGAVTGTLASFLSAIREHESGGDYTAANAGGGASGAYQFIQSTWDNEAAAAGYGQYVGRPAADAPPSVQDAVAAHMATSYYNQFGGNWADVAEAWYMPAYAGNPADQNTVPDPQAGNTQTVAQYAQAITSAMGASSAPSSSTVANSGGAIGSQAAVSFAQSQLGVPYQWGGETTGKDFDCSGLVQAAYAAAGVSLPRTAQAQYDATQKLGSSAQLQPGDLVFFGTSTKDITHVGIYVGGNQMIDAPQTGENVRTESYQWADFVGATRPSDPTGLSVAQDAAATPSTTPAATPSTAPAMSLGAYYTALDQVVSALAQNGAQIVGGGRP